MACRGLPRGSLRRKLEPRGGAMGATFLSKAPRGPHRDLAAQSTQKERRSEAPDLDAPAWAPSGLADL
eukprot:7701054-Pyramimonas_sp.AAC.1